MDVDRKNNIKEIMLNFIVPIICLGTSAILFFVVIYPSIKKIPVLKDQLTATTKTRDILTDKLARLHRFVDFKDVLEENSNLVNKVMPDEQFVPGLLDQVNKISNESGLELTKLSYSISDVAAAEEETLGYSTVVISLGAEGAYTQMIAFMKAIETASRLVNISNFRFSSNERSATQLSFTFILSAPYLEVQSSAVTDEPLTLDISSGEFVAFVNKIKELRYFELSGDLSTIPVEVIQENEINVDGTNESTLSESPTGTGGGR